MCNVIVFGFLTLAALFSSAWAGPREETLAGISRCASLSDDRSFLDCIYGAAQPMRARLGLQSAPAAQLRLVPPGPPLARRLPSNARAATTARNENVLGIFGSNGLHMMAYSFDERGLFTVTVSDGSVWRQDANDTNFAHFGGKATNYTVTITAGEFGKSRMNVRGEGGPYLVERLH